MNFKGTTSLASSVHVERTYSEANGWESTYSYKGRYADILTASTSNAYVGNAARVSVRQEDGGYGVLDVTFSSYDNAIIDQPTVEPETDSWTFAPYEVQRNAYENPKYNALDLTVDPGHKMKIVESVDAFRNKVRAEMEARSVTPDSGNPPNGNPFNMEAYMLFKYGQTLSYVDSSGTTQTYSYSQDDEDLSEELARMLLSGKDTYNEDKYILRNTRIVPGNTLLKASTWRKGYQWTTNRLVDLILAQKTEVTKYSICGELLLDFAGTYWLKKAPTITELYNGKFEIASEFINMEAGELPTEFHPIYS
jgi:hypothetical protein